MLGENHPKTAISYNNLAGLYKNQSEHKNATTYYLRAYKILSSGWKKIWKKSKLAAVSEYTPK